MKVCIFYFDGSADGLIKQLSKPSHCSFILHIKGACSMCSKRKKPDYVCFTRKLHTALTTEELLTSGLISA